MTGFVFTFSLFCTALLQSDAAMLAHVELVPVRQIIDAVLPDARPRPMFAGGHTVVPPLSRTPSPTALAVLPSTRRIDGITGAAPMPLRFLHARQIRAPAVRSTH
ncbi:MAG: hypothetical protein KFF77_10480 [Bacteroidetes bacterium]|nr:hypothetical protein [Bacteroidota bacterium]